MSQALIFISLTSINHHALSAPYHAKVPTLPVSLYPMLIMDGPPTADQSMVVAPYFNTNVFFLTLGVPLNPSAYFYIFISTVVSSLPTVPFIQEIVFSSVPGYIPVYSASASPCPTLTKYLSLEFNTEHPMHLYPPLTITHKTYTIMSHPMVCITWMVLSISHA